jgi:spore germination protein
MIIHVVKQGDTISSIADLYKIPEDRLIMDNGIINPRNLAVGQTIVIIYPDITYTVQEGDTLAGIADKNNTSVMQLLRNNPYLSDRQYIFPGETLIISYDTQKIRTIAIDGFAYSFINKDILRKTLPYLTYLTIFNYREQADGSITEVDDQEIINIAKAYGVAPIMLVSTQTEQGTSSLTVTNTLLTDQNLQDISINNIVNTMKKKGYYGLNQYFQFYSAEREELYLSYIKKLSSRLKSEGFLLMITITPRTNIVETEISYEKIDYSQIAQYADSMLFISYNWGYSYGPPASATPVNLLKILIENLTTTIPHEELFLGLPVIAYDWPLPYIQGYTKANAITNDSAISIAADSGVPIQYSDIAQAPYFFYYKSMQELHNVWFKDSRSIDAISDLVTEYNLEGISIWNLMYFFTQMWFVLNNKYNIEKVPKLNQSISTEGVNHNK